MKFWGSSWIPSCLAKTWVVATGSSKKKHAPLLRLSYLSWIGCFLNLFVARWKSKAGIIRNTLTVSYSTYYDTRESSIQELQSTGPYATRNRQGGKQTSKQGDTGGETRGKERSLSKAENKYVGALFSSCSSQRLWDVWRNMSSNRQQTKHWRFGVSHGNLPLRACKRSGSCKFDRKRQAPPGTATARRRCKKSSLHLVRLVKELHQRRCLRPKSGILKGVKGLQLLKTVFSGKPSSITGRFGRNGSTLSQKQAPWPPDRPVAESGMTTRTNF